MIIKKVEFSSNEIEEITVDGVVVYPVQECPEGDNTPPQYEMKEELKDDNLYS